MILVVGGTGNLGGLIATRLLEKGQPVRALVRSESDYGDLEAAGAEIVLGDLKEPSTLAPACNEVRQIVSTATAAARGGADTAESVDAAGYRDLIAAAETAGVDQFVFVSAHGFEIDSPVPLARAKASTEELLKESRLSYTILRPSLFMEAWIGLIVGAQLQAGPQVTVVGDPERRYGFVSAVNVADLALAGLEHPEARKAVIPLSAASASYQQIVGWAEETLGGSIAINTVEPGTMVPGLPPIVSELWGFAATGGIGAIETPEVADKFGLELLGPETFTRNVLQMPSG